MAIVVAAAAPDADAAGGDVVVVAAALAEAAIDGTVRSFARFYASHHLLS